MNSQTNSEVQNVWAKLIQNVLMIVHKVVHKQTQNHHEHEEHASTLDMNKKPRKVHLHGSIKQ